MTYATLSIYNIFRNLSKKMVIPGCWVVEYSLQWYVEVDILGENISWCTIVGITEHLPSALVRTSKIQHNSAHYPFCTFHINSPETHV